MKAVLFDLDDTLLENDVNRFMPAYFSLLSEKYAVICPPERMLPALITASEAMVREEHHDRTNKEVFWPHFLALAGIELAEAERISNRVSHEFFPSLSPLTRAVPGARQLLLDLRARGYTLVLATNPLFPRDAILERMRWADVGDIDFALITSYENMHASKPHLAYYEEILEMIGLPGKEALMVGNSLADDMTAKNAGLWTYYVHPQGGNWTPVSSSLVDWQGTLLQLRSLLLN
jgi:FMN phosphatase YigB (HAD superfamily)